MLVQVVLHDGRLPSLSACFFFLRIRRPPRSPLFPYTTLSRSRRAQRRPAADARHRPRPGRLSEAAHRRRDDPRAPPQPAAGRVLFAAMKTIADNGTARSEEHTSELQSQSNLVCRLLLEKKTLNYPLQERFSLDRCATTPKNAAGFRQPKKFSLPDSHLEELRRGTPEVSSDSRIVELDARHREQNARSASPHLRSGVSRAQCLCVRRTWFCWIRRRSRRLDTVSTLGRIHEEYEARFSHVDTCVAPLFFSSRRRHTRFDCDWSSDVCSSD